MANKKMLALLLAASGTMYAQIPVNPPGGGGGSGSVTTVSVATANGVSGTVANPTTTPAITLTLGAITPTSVVIGGGTALTSSNQTGAGSIVLATSPTLVTPNIGAATGTSLSVTGPIVSSGNAVVGTNIGSSENSYTSATTVLSTGTQLNTITLSANYSFTLASPGAYGKQICLQFVQPATGGPYTVTPPANVLGFFTVGTTASKHSIQCFVYSSQPNAWVPTSAGVINY